MRAMWRSTLLSTLLGMTAAVWSLAAAGQAGKPVDTLQPLPPGQTLPVSLEHALKAGRVTPGTPVVAFVTQRIPVSEQTYLPRGAEVLGTVVASRAESGSQPASLSLRFTALRWKGQQVPLRTKALAVASSMEVNDTYAPTSTIADRAESSPANWTTQQVGGDVLMRSSWVGQLESPGMEHVGFSDFNGVYANPPQPQAGQKSDLPRALGAFSAEARGMYGYDPASVLASAPGSMTISSPGTLVLRRGDEFLLQVVAP